MEEFARLLLADDEDVVRDSYAQVLARAGHSVDTAGNGDEVLALVRERPYDMLFVDLRFPPTDGVALLREVKRIRPQMLVVLFTGHASIQAVLEGFRGGAFEFLEKPVACDRLVELAARALEVRQLGEKRHRLAEELENERLNVVRLRQQLAGDDPFSRLVGGSAIFRTFVEIVREVARTDSTVLLTGESGTGKGQVARTIHEASVRRAGPFIEANCVVYSEGVLHSELFGHERGAFTGAARTKRGRFELAQGGTLFLDEIGEISPATQLLLLRVLQDRAFERVGGEETLEADVRLIAATNRDLEGAIREGVFRSDLYYRLNVIPVHVPALRDHAEDVPLLVEHFTAGCAARIGRDVGGYSDEAIEALTRYAWPGNIRELENLVERLVVLNGGRTVGLADLPPVVRQALERTRPHERPGTLAELERWRIVEALSEARGNKKLAARKLGIHRSTLYAKMGRYGLDGSVAGETDPDCREERQTETETPTLISTT